MTSASQYSRHTIAQISKIFSSLLLAKDSANSTPLQNPEVFPAIPIMGSVSEVPEEISVGRYVFERVKQLGIKSVFGVPGGKVPRCHVFKESLLTRIQTMSLSCLT